MRRIGRGLPPVAVASLLAYLAFWPVPIDPVGWKAPPAPRAPSNQRLKAIEHLGKGTLRGPEATAFDAQGRLYTGTKGGDLWRMDPATGDWRSVANTGGRPLGMAFDANGRLYVCDADKGLLALEPDGTLVTLATEAEGIPFKFTDDVDLGPDGTVYFSDASSKYDIREQRQDILEHGGHGRLMAYDPPTKAVRVLLQGLQFANGVAVQGEGQYVLVNETGAYRITRYWLAGPKKGSSDVFIDNLPGLPDNLTWSPARRAFWVALYSPRVPALDALAEHPRLRQVVLRVPLALQPHPKKHGMALAVDEQGRVVQDLQDDSPGAFSPVTSVREREGVLWIGSVEHDALGKLPAPPLAGAAP